MTDNTEALPRRLYARSDLCRKAGAHDMADLLQEAAMALTTRAALAQRQQVPDAVAALLRIASRLENMGRPQAANGMRLAILELEKDAALTAAPSAQAEPVAWMWETVESGTRVSLNEPADYEQVFHLTPLYAAPPAAQAEPQEPLTDEQCDRAIAGMGLGYLVRDSESNRDMLRELCRRAHGIGKQEPLQRPALVTALRGLLASLSRQPTEFELLAAAHEFTVQADRIAAGRSRREDGDG